MKLHGKQTWEFSGQLYVQATGTCVGPKEGKGPLKPYFDTVFDELYCGEKNWELAERQLMKLAIAHCLEKKNLKDKDIDLLLAGDLLNQNVTANYVAREHAIPFLCMFGACSTSMETLATACALVDGGYARRAIAATSSHNATAERQFRYPTEYGGQRPGTATFTVTGAGAILVGKEQTDIRISSATIGKVMDYGMDDPFDMGSAMAPAAFDTIKQHFKDLQRTPKDYDLIVTGDLSSVGMPICKDLLAEVGYDVSNVYNDCGLLIYKEGEEDVFAGGSGCACSAVVTYGYIMEQLKQKKMKRVLVVATGALLSPTMTQQKETIPTIAHGVVFERV
ncbi:MAG: stage V sporulation protein AD [Bacillaceae bacterium]